MFKRDKNGLRSLSPVNDVKPKNSIRILAIGASTTLQTTQETQDTWCGLLETKLLEHYGHSNYKIQTMAFGRGGWMASKNAFWIKEMFDKIDPDIVITLLGINDLTWGGGSNYKYSNIMEIFLKLETESKEKEVQEKNMLETEKKIKGKRNAVSKIKRGLNKYSQICRRIYYIKKNLEAKKS